MLREHMNDIERLLQDETAIGSRKLPQIIAFLGEGKLRDGDETFRRFVGSISNELLIQYGRECLTDNFPDSGLALQDITNEIGKRLGFAVIPGRYSGTRNDIGNDGLWKQESGTWALVVEVKTADAYRISLDTIATYRDRLIGTGEIDEERSSILIVVGRHDTGELEAQIRGSRHAWDMRIISIDSLIKLLEIKESLSDESTAQQISFALRPFEYTKVDKLIELLFLAVKDIEIEAVTSDVEPSDSAPGDAASTEEEAAARTRTKPVSFHGPVLQKAEKKTGKKFIKNSKSSYYSDDQTTGLLVSLSKAHPSYNSAFQARYWFAFHPHQRTFLEKYPNAYVSYGCGSAEKVVLLPLPFLIDRLDGMWETANGERPYKHIVIYQEGERLLLRTNVDSGEHYDDLTSFKI